MKSETILLDALKEIKNIADDDTVSFASNKISERATKALTDWASAPKEGLDDLTDYGKAVQMAKRFHELYEEYAPLYGYETRKETRDFNEDSPNGKLMIAVCEQLQLSSAPESGQNEGLRWDNEYVLASAIWYKDLPTSKLLPVNIDKGIVILGLRHAYIISTMKVVTGLRTVQFGENSVGETIQGFLTSANRFVDRQIAADIAFSAGQTQMNKKELFSEDVFTQIQFIPTLDESPAPESKVEKIGDGRIVYKGETYVNEKSGRVLSAKEFLSKPSSAPESGGEETELWEEMKSMIRAADKAYVPLDMWGKLKKIFSLRLKDFVPNKSTPSLSKEEGKDEADDEQIFPYCTNSPKKTD